jgi:hypothetical protein
MYDHSNLREETMTSRLGQAGMAKSRSRPPGKAQLVGTWQLVSIQDTIDGEAGPAVDLGANPVGFLIYQADGYMSATLVDADRPAWKNTAKPTNAEKAAYYDSFVAYCGTFKVDSKNSIVYHYPTVAWSPAFLASPQARPFRLEGDKLIITVTENLGDPGMEKRVLVWQRVKTNAQ